LLEQLAEPAGVIRGLFPIFDFSTSHEPAKDASITVPKRIEAKQKPVTSRLMSQQRSNKRAGHMGGKFTVADAYAFTIVNWTNFVGIDLKAYPNLGAYMAHVSRRPKVQEALKAEGLAK
jgi:glutathione S-transferase